MRYLLICALLVISCMPRHQAEYAVSINSFAASPSAPYGTYFLAAADPQLSASDLELREYASYVHRVLGAQGLRPVTAVKDADLAIYLAYGIGEPREHYYAYDEPVWGQTGVSSSRTTTQATIYGNTATATSDTTYTPSYGVTGYRTKVILGTDARGILRSVRKQGGLEEGASLSTCSPRKHPPHRRPFGPRHHVKKRLRHHPSWRW